MKKIKVAIIDTGIDIHDSNLKKFFIYNNDFQITDKNLISSIYDLHGHGTLCAKTIIEICSNVEIYPIKIFDENGRTNSLNLVKALKNLINSDIDLINISASTLNSTYKEELKYICDKLYKKGKVIICSHHNKAKCSESYPTFLKSVIGVKGNSKICIDEDYIYKKNKDIQMYTNSKERFFEFSNNITYFGKNSRAAAIATGIIADIYTRFGKLKFEDLESVLIEESKIRTYYKKYRFLYKKDYKSNINKQKITERIIALINQKFSTNNVNLDFVEKHSLFNNSTQIERHNAYEFLNAINDEFNISLDYRNIFLYELDNLYLLVNLIDSYISKKYAVYI
ncbi:S8 family serine peptidase [Paraclostridium sordellii]|uniref:Serine protease n=1 Tax=Paraclostridium sordellii TaxID=1505 RepID=A0A0C7EBS3_PARSO|nr:S8 family serine peptidase [Paeniclostridium sordellii]CEN21869.1 serine protease [[Clostridium] sordellii] [Paeniclostridium sordellii]CEP41818.1 serine protease [[Clostridium] sordellii] [Paeniclostridium sordellii]